MKKEKQPHEYWYYFGKCVSRPSKISEGTLPRPPYKRFNTKKECQEYIDSGKTFDPMEQMIKQGAY